MPVDIITLSSDSENEASDPAPQPRRTPKMIHEKPQPKEQSVSNLKNSRKEKKIGESSHSSRENLPTNSPAAPPPLKKPLASQLLGLRDDMEYRSPLNPMRRGKNQKQKPKAAAPNNRSASRSSNGSSSSRQRVNFDTILQKELIGGQSNSSSETNSSSSYANSLESQTPVPNSANVKNLSSRSVGGWAFQKPATQHRGMPPPLGPTQANNNEQRVQRELRSLFEEKQMRRRIRRNRARKESFHILSSDEELDHEHPFRQSNLRTPTPCSSVADSETSDMQISGDPPPTNSFLPAFPPQPSGAFPIPPPPTHNFSIPPPPPILPPAHALPPSYMPANYPSAFDIMRSIPPPARIAANVPTVVVKSGARAPPRASSSTSTSSTNSTASSNWTRISSPADCRPASAVKRNRVDISTETEPPAKKGPRTPPALELCDADTQTADGDLQCPKCLRNEVANAISEQTAALPTSKPSELFLSSNDGEFERRAEFDKWWSDVCKAKQVEARRRIEYDNLKKTAEKQKRK